MTDPQSPNQFLDASAANSYGERQDARRPVGLIVICVLAIGLSCLGLIASGFKMINLFYAAEMQEAFGSMGTPN